MNIDGVASSEHEARDQTQTRVETADGASVSTGDGGYRVSPDRGVAKTRSGRRMFLYGLVVGLVLGIAATVALGLLVDWSPGGFMTYGPDAEIKDVDPNVGDCFLVKPDERGRYSRVACESPHHVELAGIVELPTTATGAYPSRNALDFFGAAGCELAFEQHVGESYLFSGLDYRALIPSEDAWRNGAGSVYCLVRPLGPGLLEEPVGRGVGQ